MPSLPYIIVYHVILARHSRRGECLGTDSALFVVELPALDVYKCPQCRLRRGRCALRRCLAPCVQTQAQAKTEGHDPWSLAILRERLAVSRREYSPYRDGTSGVAANFRIKCPGLALVKPWPATGSTKAPGHYPTAGS